MHAILRQGEGASHHSDDYRDDDLRGAGTVKIEGLELPDTREQVGIGEIAEDVHVELRSVGIEQGRDGCDRGCLEIPPVFQREQQGDEGCEEETCVNVGPEGASPRRLRRGSACAGRRPAAGRSSSARGGAPASEYCRWRAAGEPSRRRSGSCRLEPSVGGTRARRRRRSRRRRRAATPLSPKARWMLPVATSDSHSQANQGVRRG